MRLEEEFSKEPIWENIYRKVFFNFVSMERIKIREIQKQGIDRFVKLSDNNCLTFQEKYRKVNYEDILLEEWSNKEAQTLGWTLNNDPNNVDFLNYLIVPTRTAYIFPFYYVRKCFEDNKEKWACKTRRIYVPNKTEEYSYHTVNIPVSFDDLQKAINFERKNKPNNNAEELYKLMPDCYRFVI